MIVILFVCLAAQLAAAFFSAADTRETVTRVNDYIGLYLSDPVRFSEEYSSRAFKDKKEDTGSGNEFYCIKKAKEICEYSADYNDAINLILFRASVYYEETPEDSFDHRYQSQVVSKYARFADKTIPAEYAPGPSAFLNLKTTAPIILALIVLISSYAAVNETENGMTPIIRITSRGTRDVRIRKMIVVALFGIAVSVVFCVGTYLTAILKSGSSGAFLPIQTIPRFIYCPYDISIAEAVVIYTALSALGAVLAGFLTFTIACAAKNYAVPIFASIVTAGIGYYALSSVPSFHNKFFELFNGFILLDNTKLFERYASINLFGLSFPFIPLFIAVSLFAVALFFLISVFIIPANGTKKKRISRRLIPYTSKRRVSLSISGFELKKSVGGAACILILITIAIKIITVFLPQEESAGEPIYRGYLVVLRGEYTDEKSVIISGMREENDMILAQKEDMAERFSTGEINDEEYRKYMDDYWLAYIADDELTRIENYRDQISDRENASFVYDTGWNRLFSFDNDYMLPIVCFLLSSAIFYKDKRHNADDILRASARGRKYLYVKRLVTAAICGGGAAILFTIIEAVSVLVKYPLTDPEAPVYSLLMFSRFTQSIGILQFYLLIISLRAILAACFSVIVSLAGRAIRNAAILAAAVIVTFVLPRVISGYVPWIGFFDPLSYLSPFPILRLGNTYPVLIGSAIIVLSTFIASVFCLGKTERKGISK